MSRDLSKQDEKDIYRWVKAKTRQANRLDLLVENEMSSTARSTGPRWTKARITTIT